MILSNKKGEYSITGGLSWGYIMKILLIGIVFILWILVVFNFTYIDYNERDTTTQIIFTKLLDGCFSDELGVVEEELYTKQRVDDHCLKNLDENIHVRLFIENKGEIITKSSQSIFTKEEINRFCLRGTSQDCTYLEFPVEFRDKNVNTEYTLLGVQILIV